MLDLEARAGKMLLVHDGELADVRELLEELALGYRESRPGVVAGDEPLDAAILISTPAFLASRLEKGEVGSGIRIAIVEDHAKTLLAMLSRGGIEWIVRRPFHPASLRLLLLHCLYRGPEKRRSRRVGVGAAVQYQTGWRRRGALLADISERDCRILSAKGVEVGRRLRLRLPAELAGRRTLQLEGRVVRTAQHHRGDSAHEICMLFDPLPEMDAQRLKDLLAVHARGPAVLRGRATRHLARQRDSDPREGDGVARSMIRFERGEGSEEQQASGAEGATQASAGAERRTDPRHEYQRRVIALSREATRVLIGRDISRRGMRVEPAPHLTLGSELRIAIHAPGHETPLVASARVQRDDGARGMVLQFVGLPEAAAAYLERMLDELPGLARGTDLGDEQLLVVSQLSGADPGAAS